MFSTLMILVFLSLGQALHAAKLVSSRSGWYISYWIPLCLAWLCWGAVYGQPWGR